MNDIPLIRNFMTHSPKCVSPTASIVEASALMNRHQIRHLPVEAGGEVVGILSQRDVDPGMLSRGHWTTKVEDLMTPFPYVVSDATPVAEVASKMAKEKIGSAIVVGDSGRVAGIFTVIDALNVLAEMLEDRLAEFRRYPCDLRTIALLNERENLL